MDPAICPRHNDKKPGESRNQGYNGNTCYIHRINEKAFFGYDYVNYGGVFVPVSDVEKTLLDLNSYGLSIDPETKERLNEMANRSKLLEYTSKLYGKSGTY